MIINNYFTTITSFGPSGTLSEIMHGSQDIIQLPSVNLDSYIQVGCGREDGQHVVRDIDVFLNKYY